MGKAINVIHQINELRRGKTVRPPRWATFPPPGSSPWPRGKGPTRPPSPMTWRQWSSRRHEPPGHGGEQAASSDGLAQRPRQRTLSADDFGLTAELGARPPAPHITPCVSHTLRICFRPQHHTNDSGSPHFTASRSRAGCPPPAHGTVSLTWRAVGPNRNEPARLHPSTAATFPQRGPHAAPSRCPSPPSGRLRGTRLCSLNQSCGQHPHSVSLGPCGNVSPARSLGGGHP